MPSAAMVRRQDANRLARPTAATPTTTIGTADDTKRTIRLSNVCGPS
ncbi:Uncharacterised protein [Mycobacteroides abscessus subsp. abscessus]|nr:Uncharacterised protein [Mycobacteroides abscessus subsp. abscessus]